MKRLLAIMLTLMLLLAAAGAEEEIFAVEEEYAFTVEEEPVWAGEETFEAQEEEMTVSEEELIPEEAVEEIEAVETEPEEEPVGIEEEKEEATSGKCGANLTWTLDSDGVLTISGSGAMYNWDEIADVPWYKNRSSIKTVKIGNGVTSIGNRAFSSCSNLTSITIPDSVTSIGEWAFSNCSSLTSITIPDSVTSIGWYAFYTCYNLTSITIPDSVTSIGSYAFDCCYSLTSITIPNSVTSIGDSAFIFCVSLTSITIPDSVTSIGRSAFNGCRSLTSITIPNSVTSIGERAFARCDKLADANGFIVVHNVLYDYIGAETSITIPDSVTSIGAEAFDGCSSLTSITIPDSVTRIGSYAFFDCSSLTSILFSKCSSYLHSWEQSSGYGDKVNVLSHKDFVASSEPVPATCTKTGMTARGHCTICGDVEPKVIPLLPHTPTVDEAIEPTDTEPGLTEGSHCSVCGKVLVAQQRIHPLLWEIEEKDGQITITKHYGTASRVSVPTTINGLPVTSIADSAFTGSSCPSSVYIPAGITSIGQTAFSKKTTVYCHEYSEADYWADEVGYPKVYVDDTANGTFYQITMPAAFTLEYGESRQLGATVWPLIGEETQTITSSAPEIVAVKGDKLTAKAVGQATITLKVGGKTASVKVTVHANPTDFALLDVDGSAAGDIYVETKGTRLLSVGQAVPEGAELTITWSSSGETIATVSASGLVTAKRPGTATITATAQNGVARSRKIIVCTAAASVAFSQAEYRVAIGSPLALTAHVTTVTGEGYDNQMLTFSSADPAIAAIDANGTVTALKAGTVTVTAATANGLTATAQVVCYCPKHNTVTVKGKAATCTEAGLTDGRYCTVCGEVFNEQEEIAPLGHDWHDTVYTWADDSSTVTATRVCARNAKHVETETVQPASYVEVPATCTEMGQTMYIARFTNADFAIQSRTLTDIPAKGHDWSAAAYIWKEDNTVVIATRRCNHDKTHIESETAAVTATVTKKPTYTERGETTYTSAPFENPAFTAQTMTLADIEPLRVYLVTGITARPVDTNAARIEWIKTDRADGYQLWRSYNGSDFKWIKNVTVNNASNYSLAPGGNYKYKVRAYVGEGADRVYGEFSEEVSVHILGEIKNFTVTGKDTNCSFLKWDKVAGCTGYQVFRTVAGSGEYQWVKNATTAQVANYSLTPGTTYYYKIRAYVDLPDGKRAYGQYSEGVKVYIQPQVSVTLKGGNKQIAITWSKADGATGYQIFYTEAGTGGEYTWWKNIPAGTLTATLTGLKAKTDYWFKVRSYVDLPGGGRYYGQLSEAKHAFTK